MRAQRDVVGLCHGMHHVQHHLAAFIGKPFDETSTLYAGINHLTFIYDFRWKGEDAWPLVRAKVDRELAEPADPDDIGNIFADGTKAWNNPFSWEIFRRYGAFPAAEDRHVTEFFPERWASGKYYGKTLGVDAYSVPEILEWGENRYRSMVEQADGTAPLDESIFDRSSGEQEQLIAIIAVRPHRLARDVLVQRPQPRRAAGAAGRRRARDPGRRNGTRHPAHRRARPFAAVAGDPCPSAVIGLSRGRSRDDRGPRSRRRGDDRRRRGHRPGRGGTTDGRAHRRATAAPAEVPMSDAAHCCGRAAWFAAEGKTGIMHRSWLRSEGLPDDSFEGRPVIGIANSWSELTPCNMHFRELAEHVKRGIWQAGGVPFEFPTTSAGEPLLRPSAMLLRNLISMDLEETLRANPLDAVVLLAGCDKTTPAYLMGAASVDLPTILLTGGPMLNGKYRGTDIGSGTSVWRLTEQFRAGRDHARPSCPRPRAAWRAATGTA